MVRGARHHMGRIYTPLQDLTEARLLCKELTAWHLAICVPWTETKKNSTHFKPPAHGMHP
jgi:hypothetical protein